MKIRIRAMESKKTMRIDIQEDSSLLQLKESIAQAIGVSSPLSLRLSLNRSDELFSLSPKDSLASLELPAGSVIFYSCGGEALGGSAALTETSETPDADADADAKSAGKYLESRFLKKLIRFLDQDQEVSGTKLLVLGVHILSLESGFVGLFGNEISCPSSMNSSFTVHYTLPPLADQDGPPSVALTFESLENIVNIHGYMARADGSGPFCISFDEYKFVHWIGPLLVSNLPRTTSSEGVLFELWKALRDGLTLPLMIQLCESAGLPGPSRLARLPTNLLVRILVLLPGVEVARLSSVCWELQYMTRDRGLWRHKLTEEFPVHENLPQGAEETQREKRWVIPWRIIYRECWQSRRLAEDRQDLSERLLQLYRGEWVVYLLRFMDLPTSSMQDEEEKERKKKEPDRNGPPRYGFSRGFGRAHK